MVPKVGQVPIAFPARRVTNICGMLNGLVILTGIVVAAFLLTVLGFWRKDRDEPLLAWTKHTGEMILEVFFLLVALVSVLLLAISWLRG